MITLQSLMRKNKKELSKLFRETGRAANSRLAEYRETDTFKLLDPYTQEIYNNLLRDNRGKFKTNVLNSFTKKEMSTNIIRALQFMELPEPQELEEDDASDFINEMQHFGTLQTVIDYDPSEFYRIFNDYKYNQGYSNSEIMTITQQAFEMSKTLDEFYTLFAAGGVWLD